MDSFRLGEDVVGQRDVGWEREVGVGDWEGCRGVYGGIEGELDSFD